LVFSGSVEIFFQSGFSGKFVKSLKGYK